MLFVKCLHFIKCENIRTHNICSISLAKCRFTHFPSFFSVHVDTYKILPSQTRFDSIITKWLGDEQFLLSSSPRCVISRYASVDVRVWVQVRISVSVRVCIIYSYAMIQLHTEVSIQIQIKKYLTD